MQHRYPSNSNSSKEHKPERAQYRAKLNNEAEPEPARFEPHHRDDMLPSLGILYLRGPNGPASYSSPFAWY